jgi:pimeloyl-ACP methyl ester carboxylesterase
MERVMSVDGTPIAYTCGGSGAPVLLVHGGPSTGEAWAAVTPLLESRFTIAAMDRRGRGASGDGHEYSLDLEAADVAAVVEALGGDVHLVGHSSGARVALLAATRRPGLQSLTLYEPPLSLTPVEDDLNRVMELVRAGKTEAATELFFSGVAATSEELERIRSLPAVWDRFVASIHSAPREARALLDSGVDHVACGRIDVPVLLLVGALTTAPQFVDGLDELEAAFGDVRREVIPGQRHLANAFAPEAFAGIVETFLDRVGVDSLGGG